MKRTKPTLIIVIVAMIMIGLVNGVGKMSDVSAMRPQPQEENCKRFDETGLYVCDEFLEFYEAQGGIEIFGYPLTETFYDSASRQVQYFQRARLELHPRASGGYKVMRGFLVEQLGYRFPSLPEEQIPPFNNLHRYFPETGHAVSYAFLDYFREQGGLETFGYPRSEFMLEGEYIVQYFDWARMEWHPELASGPQIRLTNLGEIYIERFGLPGEYNGSQRIGPVTRLRVSASVRHVIIGQGEKQTVYVYVTDQWRRPIKGATISVIVHNGRYECEPTDASGFTRSEIGVSEELPPGRKVVIDVKVRYENVEGATQIFFLPWW
ncbi:MAG: hypothetical protein U9R15_00815 [Chloroflexota bacterium]|nr:hypothetical protein [Chloroflexota bacterium]